MPLKNCATCIYALVTHDPYYPDGCTNFALSTLPHNVGWKENIFRTRGYWVVVNRHRECSLYQLNSAGTIETGPLPLEDSCE